MLYSKAPQPVIFNGWIFMGLVNDYYSAVPQLTASFRFVMMKDGIEDIHADKICLPDYIEVAEADLRNTLEMTKAKIHNLPRTLREEAINAFMDRRHAGAFAAPQDSQFAENNPADPHGAEIIEFAKPDVVIVVPLQKLAMGG